MTDTLAIFFFDMPLIYIADNIYYQGSQVDFNTITLYASWYAGLVGGVNIHLRGNPPIFFPLNPTPESLWLFLCDFAEGFEIIAPVIESMY